MKVSLLEYSPELENLSCMYLAHHITTPSLIVAFSEEKVTVAIDEPKATVFANHRKNRWHRAIATRTDETTLEPLRYRYGDGSLIYCNGFWTVAIGLFSSSVRKQSSYFTIK
ncbi:hypothetical protein HAX54_003643, partial [Datura stramonium]|nr:hypothetical protein [Datura stramonium]